MARKKKSRKDKSVLQQENDKSTRMTLLGIPFEGIDLFWIVLFAGGAVFLAHITDLPGHKIIYGALGVVIYSFVRNVKR